MSRDTQSVIEWIRYTRYPILTALVILVNDTLNLHIREDNVTNWTSIPEGDHHRLTLHLNSTVRSESTGVTYDGQVSILYTKLDAGLVYPNGFYTNRRPGAGLNTLRTLLELLERNTRVIIRKEEVEVVEENGIYWLQVLENSVLWQGRIRLRGMDEIHYEVKSNVGVSP